MNESYRLVLSSDSSDLEKGLQQIQDYMDKLENSKIDAPIEEFNKKLQTTYNNLKKVQDIQQKTEGKSYISANDMNQVIKSTQKARQEVSGLQDALSKVTGVDDNAEQSLEALKNAMKDVDGYVDTLSKKEIGADASIRQRQKEMVELNQTTREYKRTMEELSRAKLERSEVRTTNKRVSNTISKSEDNNKLSYKQGAQMRADFNKMGTYGDRMGNVDKYLGQLRDKQQSSRGDVNRLMKEASQENLSESQKKALEDNIASIKNEQKARSQAIKEFEKLRQELDKGVQEEGGLKEQFSTRRIEADRGTFRGMMQERAPSIGSHAVMGALAPATAMFLQGRSLSETNKPYSRSLGQQMGTDIDSVRQDFANQSIDNRLGLTGTEMLQTAESITAGSGIVDEEQVQDMVGEVAQGTRSMGIRDDESYREALQEMMHTGGLSGNNLKETQDAIYGGIKRSGLEGRADEQVQALSDLTQQVGTGRELTDTDMQNILATQSALNDSGSRALQGTQGADLLSGLNEGLKSSLDSPYLRNVLGFGTEFGGGVEGIADYQRQVERGISDPENLTAFYDNAVALEDSEEARRSHFGLSLQTLDDNITMQQADELYDLMDSGELDSDKMKERLQEITDSGETLRDENIEDYQESRAGKDDQNRAIGERNAEDLYDDTGAFRDMVGSIGKFGAYVSIFAGAVGGLALSLGKSVLMQGGGALLRRGMRSGGTRGGTGSMANRAGQTARKATDTVKGVPGKFTDAVKGSALFGGASKGSFSKRAGKTMRKGTDSLKNIFKGGGKSGIVAGTSNLASKAMLPLSLGMSAMGIKGDMEEGNSLNDSVMNELSGWIDPFGMGYGSNYLERFKDKNKKDTSLADKIGLGYFSMDTDKSDYTNTFGKDIERIKGWFGKGKDSGNEPGRGGGGGDASMKVLGDGEGTLNTIPNLPPSTGGSGVSNLGFFSGQNDGVSAILNRRQNPKRREDSRGESGASKFDVEKLREKNIGKEKESQSVYKNLLDRFESLIQSTRSLSLGKGGTSGSEGGSASSVGGEGEEKVWNFFKDKGLKDEQIAGIIGNLKQESNLDPTAENASSGAFGIAQWLGGRKTNLQNFASKNGGDMKDLDTQLDYLWHEMNTSEKHSLGRFNKATNVKDATTYWANDFERMAPGEAMMGTRISEAEKAKNRYSGGRGGGDFAPSIASTMNYANLLQPTGTSSGSGSTSRNVTNNNRVTVSINVDGSESPEDTAHAIREELNNRLNSDLELLANSHRRV